MFDMLPHTSLVLKGNFFLNVLGRQPKEIFLQDRLSVQAAMGFFFSVVLPFVLNVHLCPAIFDNIF